MKTEVRYQSKSGNTAKVAQAIADGAGVTAQSVSAPLSGGADLLFLGGAVYAGTISRELKKFIRALEPGQVKAIALFSTAAGEKNISAKVEKLLQGKNIRLVGSEFHATSGGLEQSLPLAEEFAKKAIAGMDGQ